MEPKKPSNNNPLRYLGLAGQMIGIILLGALLGRWLDGYFSTPMPYFSAGVTLFFVFFALWYVLKDLIVKK